MRRVWWFAVSSVAFALLAGCKPSWFETREPWRHEAEERCLASGAVKESAAVVMLRPIEGPGICGADFPLKVAALGEDTPLAYGDDIRPPGSVPQGAPAPQANRYPSYPPPQPSYSPVNDGAPVSLDPAGGQGGANGPTSYPPSAPTEDGSRYPEAPQTTAPAPSPPMQEQAPFGPVRPAPMQTVAAVSPPATLACPIVSALDRWIAEAVQPAAQRWFNQPVVEIKQISAYSCRGMNGQPGAHISEHAFGNALDIAAFVLADGRKITVERGWHGAPEEQGFLRDVQAAACAQFTTVLAPGSNQYHYNHIHVDLMRRRNGRRVCEPDAVSGEEVAARAAARGRDYAQRPGFGPVPPSGPPAAGDDPFAWRGGRRDLPTGSIPGTKAAKPRRAEPADDEDALDE